MKDTAEILRYASHLAPVLLLLIGWRHRSLLWWYALAALFTDTAMLLLRRNALGNEWIGNLFLALEFMLFSLYYYRSLGRPAAVQIMAGVFGTTYIFQTLITDVEKLNLLGGALLCIAYLGYALAGFRQLLRTTPTPFPEKSKLFWVSAAVMLYAATHCLFYLFYQDKLSEQKTTKDYWISFYCAMNVLKVFLLIPAVRREDSSAWKQSA